MNPRTRSLALLAAIVVAIVGFFAVGSLRERARVAEARQQDLAAVDRLVAAGGRDAAEISALVARLSKLLPDDRAAALALARIEWLRGRAESAANYLEPLMFAGAEPQELRLAVRVWSTRMLRGGRDASERAGWLQDALRFADALPADAVDAGDVFAAWQAALRLGNVAAAEARAAVLQERFAGSLEQRTVARIATSADLEQPIGPVEQLLSEWTEPPVELALMHAVLLLQSGAVDRGTAAIDALLAQAPNLVEVRNFAATAHHMAGLLVAAGPERDRHLTLRDAQVRWLDANADAGDARRPQWLAMLQAR